MPLAKDGLAAASARICVAFLTVVLIIGVYGHLRCRLQFQDPLATSLGVADLDGWSVTHFLFFSILGYVFPGPQKGAVAFLGGTAWELVEHWMGKSRPPWMGGWGGCQAPEMEAHNANWWYGRPSDLVMNGLGLLAGNAARAGAGAVRPAPPASGQSRVQPWGAGARVRDVAHEIMRQRHLTTCRQP